jgi:replicative DNA helicase
MTDNEAAVLACIIRDPSVISRVRAHLMPEDFQTPDARSVYEAVLEAKDKGKDIDVAVVAMDLEQGHDRLLGVADGFVSSANIGFYLQAMQSERVVKRIAVITKGAESAIANTHRPYPKLLAKVREEIEDMKMFPDSLAEDAGAIADEVLEESMENEGLDFTGKETGYPRLDHMVDGFHPGDYIVLGARTTVGKSALALNLATVISTKEPVLYLSFEMPAKQLMYRLYASLAEIDSKLIRRRSLTDAQRKTLMDTRESIKSLKLKFDAGHPSVSKLISDIEQAHQAGVRTVVVDYLQLVPGDRPGRQSDYERVTEVSGRLRDLSKRLGVTILALSQLKRESDEKKIPTLTDLRESGAIEQDADVVLLLHRKRLGDELDTDARLAIAKNRYGDCGSVFLRFEPPFTRFVAA